MVRVHFKAALKSKKNKKFKMMASSHKNKLLEKRSLNLWTMQLGREKMEWGKIKRYL